MLSSFFRGPKFYRSSSLKVIAINSNHFDTHYNLGLVLHKVGDLNSAIVSYQKAVEIKPNYFEAYNNMGNALEDRGDIKLAIQAYQKALTIKPDSFQACQNILKRPTGFLKVKTLDMIQNSLLKFSNHNEHSKNIGSHIFYIDTKIHNSTLTKLTKWKKV